MEDYPRKLIEFSDRFDTEAVTTFFNDGGPTVTARVPLTFCHLENLIDDFRMQDLTRMEGNDDSLFFFHVDTMTAFASLQPEPRLQEHILRFRR